MNDTKKKIEEKEIKEKILDQLLIDHPIQEMVKFSEIDIQDKLKENSFQIIKYTELHHKELSIMDNLQIKYDKLVGIRYKHFRFDDDKEWTKVEIEKYCLPSDPKIIQMKKIMDRQSVRIRFFEMAYKAFVKQQWSMKIFSENLRGGY